MITGGADASADMDSDALYAPIVLTKSVRAAGGAGAGARSGRKWRQQLSSSINSVIWKFSPTVLSIANAASTSNVTKNNGGSSNAMLSSEIDSDMQQALAAPAPAPVPATAAANASTDSAGAAAGISASRKAGFEDDMV